MSKFIEIGKNSGSPVVKLNSSMVKAFNHTTEEITISTSAGAKFSFKYLNSESLKEDLAKLPSSKLRKIQG